MKKDFDLELLELVRKTLPEKEVGIIKEALQELEDVKKANADYSSFNILRKV